MKPDVNQLFGNLFNDKNITDTRFYNFCTASQSKLTAANTGGKYDLVLSTIASPILQLGVELGDVDIALAIQKGATLTNNQVLTGFKKTLSDEEPFILRAVGGKGTPAALEFFPRGLSEYTAANKTTMPTLTNRIAKAAKKYEVPLGNDLSEKLQSFDTSWKNSRDAQEQQMGHADENRTERDAVRASAELVMLFAIHTVAAQNPGDVVAGEAIFDFRSLFPPVRHRQLALTGTLAEGEAKMLLNRTLKEGNVVRAHNTDVNAAWCIYLGATADAPAPPGAIILQPGERRDIHPSELGDASVPFLIIKNMSEVNGASYEVVVEGVEEDGQ